MNREDRAKQFAPFDALKGLKEALREKEREHEMVEKPEITEERQEEMQPYFSKLEKGLEVNLVYYEKGYYVELCGLVQNVDFVFRFLQIKNKKVYFEDIIEIKC